jgi:hypothetical protein
MCCAAHDQDIPGPLDYCPDPTPFLPSAPCYSIAVRTASSAAAAGSDGPGPGGYDVGAQQAGLTQSPAWTLGARVAAARPSGCNSPGKYRLPHHTHTCVGLRNSLTPPTRLYMLLTACNSRLCIRAATEIGTPRLWGGGVYMSACPPIEAMPPNQNLAKEST